GDCGVMAGKRSDGVVGEEFGEDSLDRLEATIGGDLLALVGGGGRTGFGTATRAADTFAGKRQRDAVAFHLAGGDVNDVGQGIAVEDAGDGVAHVEHEHAQAAVDLVGTAALFVGGLADAADGRARAVDQTNDVADGDVVGRTRKPVAAVFAALAGDETGGVELLHDLLQELGGDELLVGQLGDLHEIATNVGGDAEVDQRAQSVFTFFGELHGTVLIPIGPIWIK